MPSKARYYTCIPWYSTVRSCAAGLRRLAATASSNAPLTLVRRSLEHRNSPSQGTTRRTTPEAAQHFLSTSYDIRHPTDSNADHQHNIPTLRITFTHHYRTTDTSLYHWGILNPQRALASRFRTAGAPQRRTRPASESQANNIRPGRQHHHGGK